MSSRAAGGRKRQLKPLQHQQPVKKATGSITSKPNKGFFSRSKSKAPANVSAFVTAQDTVVHPSSPPTTPNPLTAPPRTPVEQSAHGQEIMYRSRSPDVRPLMTPQSHTESLAPQQRYVTGMPTTQSGYSAPPEPFLISDGETYLDASYQPPPRIQSLSTRSIPRVTPSPSYHNSNIIYEDPRILSPLPQSQTVINTGGGTEDTYQQQRPGPLRVYSRSTPPTPILSGAPYPLYSHSGASSSPVPTELPIHHLNSRSHTSLGRPNLQPHVERGSRDRSPNLFLHPNYRQVHGDGYYSDGTPPIYPPHPNSSPGSAPSPLEWIGPPSSLNGSEPRAVHQSLNAFSSPSCNTSEASSSSTHEISYQSTTTISTPSSSSDRSVSLISDSTSDSKPPGFIFPGSRSTARPKVSSKTGTPQKINIRSQRKKHQGDGVDYPITPTTPYSDSFTVPPSPSVSSLTRTELRTSGAPTHSTRSGTNSDNAVSTTTTILSTSTSSSSSASNSRQTFVFPSSRSRARPNRTLATGKKKSGRSGFMGISLKLKKKEQGSIRSLGELDSDRGTPLSSGQTLSMNKLANSSGSRLGARGDSKNSEEQGDEYWRLSPSHSTVPIPAEVGRAKRGKVKGRYPLDPYDSLLLDNDRHTGELLRRLNPTNTPTFHNYGNMPPTTVLDLGCGQGHWVLDAAIFWKGYGTRVTGFDMVDTTKSLRLWAVRQGVADNIKFVRGNFLDQPLPFPDESFDLVRMSCLTLCITSGSWEFVLQEVFRVLTLGGRLELIDDQIFFPYGKAPPPANDYLPVSPASSGRRSDFTISNRAPTFSTHAIDSGTTNPGLGLALLEEKSKSEDLYGLFGLCEEGEEEGVAGDDKKEDERVSAVKLSGITQGTDPSTQRATPRPEDHTTPQPLTASEWNQQEAISRDLEVLFEHLLTHKYDIHIKPSTFLPEVLKKVFGHARGLTTARLMVAPPSVGPHAEGRKAPTALATSAGAFVESPGLMIWPSTLIPMSPAEIEIHTSKHLTMLLSCKNNLVEYALEATEDEEIDEESVLEAVWEYENFLQQRFYSPVDQYAEHEGRSSIPMGTEIGRKGSHHSNDSISDMSVFSTTSVSTEIQDAMLDYQTDFREHFSWPLDTSEALNSLSMDDTRPTMPAPRTHTNGDTVPSPTSTIEPLNSRIEPTHVRTFRVYEAAKGFTLGATL
ncbi:hypothetical protein P691DRAFT_217399 [Macrolepiota fuliginosa MF-IS2]|uniref:Methyltransferase domain-containing protein n=1 Tax=Macrolepiota fuliginosa MF-IS2 TaxID=1400762 RepID=A0A9P6C255_9AGAR|nr:hypothetical protein P691DRAFT_217399 [Macrolepiota fuliginosa MF-IS2]